MPKYICNYCGVALTHDSMSVRRSHAVGRNHIKYVIDYYENAAKEEGMLPLDMPSSTDPATPPSALPSTSNSLDQSKQLRELYSGVPGLTPRRKTSSTTDQVKRTKRMPFPSHIAELPQPPPQFYYSKA